MTVNFSNEDPLIDPKKPSIFLAGPTRRNSPYEKSWRKAAVDKLKSMKFDGIAYVPEFEKDSQFDYNNQVMWERSGLMNANVILFWVPRNIEDNMPAFTTNVEFGMYLAKRPDHVLLAYPEDAEKMDYLSWLYHQETGRDAISQFDVALFKAMELANTFLSECPV